MKSIKERSVEDEELGMFWRDLELSWWWFRAPIETQAVMIEAFDEVVGDALRNYRAPLPAETGDRYQETRDGRAQPP